MEITYDGALVLPSNCVTMDEEEMTYTDGGSFREWASRTSTVARFIDAGLIVAGFGFAVHASRKTIKYILQYCRGSISRVVRHQLIKYAGISIGSYIWTGINLALTLSCGGIGSLIATGLDYADGHRNGHVFY